MPGTGASMTCDRKLVLKTLTTWFYHGSHSVNVIHNEQEALEDFEQVLRGRFAEWVSRHAGPTRLNYSLLLVAFAPIQWRFCDAGAGVEAVGDVWIALRWLLCNYTVFIFATMPAFCKLIMHLAVLFDQKLGLRQSKIGEFLVTVLLGFLIVLLIILQWLPLNYLNQFVSPLPILAWDVLTVTLAVFLFNGTPRKKFVPTKPITVRAPRGEASPRVSQAAAQEAAAGGPGQGSPRPSPGADGPTAQASAGAAENLASGRMLCSL